MLFFIAIVGFPAGLYAVERATAFVRKSRIESRRANAAYPITSNDPMGRTIV